MHRAGSLTNQPDDCEPHKTNYHRDHSNNGAIDKETGNTL